MTARLRALFFTTGLVAGVAVAGTGFWIGGGLSARTGEIVTSLKVADLEQQLTAERAARMEAERRRDVATQRLNDTHLRLSEAETARREAEGTVAALGEAREQEESARRALAASLEMREREVGRLAGALAAFEAESATRLQATDRIAETMARVISERDFALAGKGRLSSEVDALELEIVALTDRETRLIAELESATKVGLSGLERLFEQVDMDLDAILTSTGAEFSGKGGPLNETGGGLAAGKAYVGDADLRIASLLADVEKVGVLRFAANRVPFASPVNGGRLTSGFGPRRDPFRGRRSQHDGIDIAAPTGTPIYASADGVVTFSGWQRGYGRTIIVRHAFGFETLYAHLSKSRVEVGQRVSVEDRIGDMGNTGRSTGPHLHYEVRLNGRAIDPKIFIEAARDVL
ncbi:MAG: peptidoglycan DD-metalloendopeptidase family protein [Pseudomonadota bacterium]